MMKTMMNGVEKRSDVNAEGAKKKEEEREERMRANIKGVLSVTTALQKAAVFAPAFLFPFFPNNDILTKLSYCC